MHELLGAAEIAQFQSVGGGVHEDILGFDVAVADVHGVDVGNGAEQLVRVQLRQQGRHLLLHLVVGLHHFVHCVRNEIHHHVQVDLVLLISISVEVLAQFNAVLVVEDLHDLEFSVLELLVLERLLYRHYLSRLRHLRFVHHSERPAPNNLLRIISNSRFLLLSEESTFEL